MVENRDKLKSAVNKEGDVFLELDRHDRHSLDDYKMIITKKHMKLIYHDVLVKDRIKIGRFPMHHRVSLYIHSVVASVISELTSPLYLYLIANVVVFFVLFKFFNDELQNRMAKLENILCKNQGSHQPFDNSEKMYLCWKCDIAHKKNEQIKTLELLKVLPFYESCNGTF